MSDPVHRHQEEPMGWGSGTNSEGRDVGYRVDADCDKDGCAERIDRGMGYACGGGHLGMLDESEPGCGRYYCGAHQGDHDCPNPRGYWEDHTNPEAVAAWAKQDEETAVHWAALQALVAADAARAADSVEDGDLAAGAAARMARDTGARHSLDDVVADLGIDGGR